MIITDQYKQATENVFIELIEIITKIKRIEDFLGYAVKALSEVLSSIPGGLRWKNELLFVHVLVMSPKFKLLNHCLVLIVQGQFEAGQACRSVTFIIYLIL